MSIGNPADWNYQSRTLSGNITLKFDDPLLQRLQSDGGTNRNVELPVGKNQGRGCVIIANEGASGRGDIVVKGTNIQNSGDISLAENSSEAIQLEYFSNSDPDADGFWYACGAKYT